MLEKDQNLKKSLNENINDHLYLMKMALDQANQAYSLGEVPVGAVLVDKSGSVIAKTYNEKEINKDPTAHAEILAVRRAAKQLNSWRLIDTTLYVTLEPCPMCLNALLQARIKKVVFGTYDYKGGALSLGYHYHNDLRLNHQLEIVGGINQYECSRILSQFFKERRKGHHLI